MTTKETVLPPVISLREIEIQAARLGAANEAQQAYARKNERDDFTDHRIETMLSGAAELQLGGIALSLSNITHSEFSLPSDEK